MVQGARWQHKATRIKDAGDRGNFAASATSTETVHSGGFGWLLVVELPGFSGECRETMRAMVVRGLVVIDELITHIRPIKGVRFR
ncbi:hypothetical protein SAMN05660652_01881 [Propionivibrio dicarboxylicus]|uniref:Uncharacterized protein n=1 Tax=Propionivibrio dicarboxylicus TaxID=83767 RepID=A0A1G8DBE6_9RHOO|nr:hypothetical protein SAMN05660652_01881 [Propionivibrio dicarboxylicus]